MPLPKVKEGEQAVDYLKRCIPIEVEAGKRPDEAAAICYKEYETQKQKR